MALYALIGGENTVKGIVDIENEQQLQRLTSVYAQAIDITHIQPTPQIGWSFDGQSIVGTSPSKRITRLAMRQRFTFSELLALTTAAAASMPVKVLMDNLSVATFVDLSRPDTVGGINLLVGAGLLTSQRASEILNNPVSPAEAYVE